MDTGLVVSLCGLAGTVVSLGVSVFFNVRQWHRRAIERKEAEKARSKIKVPLAQWYRDADAIFRFAVPYEDRHRARSSDENSVMGLQLAYNVMAAAQAVRDGVATAYSELGFGVIPEVSLPSVQAPTPTATPPGCGSATPSDGERAEDG